MTVDPGWMGLAAAFGLLLVPLAVMARQGIPMIRQTLVSVARMTVQLLLVGLYLQWVFTMNRWWLTSLWLLAMVAVATFTILRGSGLKARALLGATAPALVLGTAVPLFWFVGLVLRNPDVLEARYVIPVGGMILGNCLRANIVGIRDFYQHVRDDRKAYQLVLAQGASLCEAVCPYLRRAFQAAVSPTLATMTTIGIVSLPGMMTGVILGGSDPVVAIRYQIAIMIAIFAGTAITVPMAIYLTLKRCFNAYGLLREDVFAQERA